MRAIGSPNPDRRDRSPPYFAPACQAPADGFHARIVASSTDTHLIDPPGAAARTAELRAWLQLLSEPGLGREGVRRLLAQTRSVHAAVDALPTLRQRGVTQACPPDQSELALETAVAAHTGPERNTADAAALLQATLQWLNETPGAGHGASLPPSGDTRAVLTIDDPRYPARLLESPDAPLLLYARGNLQLLNRSSIAIVGSRNATPQGLENARAFAAELSRRGITIVSGLALGVDGAAHEGGLEGEGRTIAVVGTGLDRVYPSRHLKLAHRIVAEGGLMLSEYPLGTPPLPACFPQRNRIIAGLSLGTLVVEAAMRSGSLITARLALDAGRDVFAIPGSIHSPHARGCNALIRQGAKLVEQASDIVEELPVDILTAPPEAFMSASHSSRTTPEHESDEPGRKRDPLLEALEDGAARSLDELVARTGIDASTIQAHLLDLELEGRVSRLPGQCFQRMHRA